MKSVGKFRWVFVVGFVILVNLISIWGHFRLDLTNEHRFTISRPVRKILRDLPGPVQVQLFLNGPLPSGFKKLSASTVEMLAQFNDISRGKLSYALAAPDETFPGARTSYGDSLSSLGILPINLTVQVKTGEQSQYVYPAALVQYEGRSIPVHLYPGTKSIITPTELNSAEAMLEYRLADAINRVVHNKVPLLAYSVGNGEPTGANTYDLVENVMRKDYQLFTIDIKKEPIIPDTFQALLIVKPSVTFDDDEKLKIDQYIMHGGKVIWLIDRLEAEMDSLQIRNQVIAYDRNLQLEDLLFRYGVRINPDLVMDLQSDFLPFDVSGNKQFEFLHWNYFPLFESDQSNVINKNLGLVEGKFVNSLDTVAAPGIRKTILLRSSPNARTIHTPALISPSENRNAPEDAAFKTAHIPVGVLLEGKFTSLYKNRVSRSRMDTLAAYNMPFLSEALEAGKMIVVGDGDIVLNSTSQNQPLPMGVNPFTLETQYQYQFSNRQFIQNCIEYLVGNNELNAARSKDYTLRLLDPEKSKSQKIMWQLIDLVGPVLLVFIFGLFYQYWRKRKYSS